MKKNVIKLCLFAVIISSALQGSAFAQNVLSAIQINPEGESYQVLLKSDKAVPIKKVIESSDKIYLELSNIEPSEAVNTIYNSVPDINNVIVEPTSKNGVKIVVKGKNVNNANVKFETLENLTTNEKTSVAKDSIELNPPVRAYNPIYEEDFDEEENNNGFASLKALLLTALKSAKNLMGSNTLYFLGTVLILAFGARLFRKSATSKSPLPIGLPKNLQSAESAEQSRMKVNSKERLKAQQLLSEANRIKNKTVTNYGINSYRNAQKSPYERNYGLSGLKYRSTPLTTVPSSSSEIKSSALADLKSKVVTATLNSHATNTSKQSKQSVVDSTKFLDSMTKIYERNGRSDLAEGLRNSLKKAQSNKIHI